MRKWTIFFLACTIFTRLSAQKTFPIDGITDNRDECYAFTHATIIKDNQSVLQDATLVIRKGKIVSLGNVPIPLDAVVIDCKDKYIYPSFIDLYSDYGIPTVKRESRNSNYWTPVQFESNKKGPFGWNQAIRTDVNAMDTFSVDDTKAQSLREIGFGTVLSHQKDGIARGTGTLVTLANEKENLVIVKDKASAHYSFNKGISTQSYPSSLMGSIALLRQTFLDAQWYKSAPAIEGTNLSLKLWNEQQSLPQIFEANDKWNAIRADRLGDEFGIQYIIKGGGNEYQRLKEIKATHAAFILPIDFPKTMDVTDSNDARFVSLADMKHWEMAPASPGLFEKEGIIFALTASDLKDSKQFLVNLRKAIEFGLSEQKALEALTKIPATLLGAYDKVGSLDKGKLANFIITSGPLFHEKTVFYQNWIQGKRYDVKNEQWQAPVGTYTITTKQASGNTKSYTLQVKNENTANIIASDTISAKFSFNGKLVQLSFGESKQSKEMFRLSGVSTGDGWQGNGVDSSGNNLLWSAAFVKSAPLKDSIRKHSSTPIGTVTYPFGSYGWEKLPSPSSLLIKNTTVWTNEKEGIQTDTDVLIKNGKITVIGRGLSDNGVTIIDGRGKHLTPGIIDEHSHIATASVNEGAQSITSEVRIGDNLNPDDINIYRQLSGGVTTSHILHGSANSIGGQTQLIKLRWGQDDEGLKFKGADPFIKFALGENVKRTMAQSNNRFPDTRMGVEQMIDDAFQRATDYQNALKGPHAKTIRRDLELDALVEIMNKKRFITSHSYVQSEITALMRVAEKYNFKVNTFTHILEGYKVADKMKEHGANVSTFSDWWAYKVEVTDAIAYNAALMQKMGLNVCINSDDAEMARRLNQEAAKAMKYGDINEEEALKMVTLNPAKALHIEQQVGSIKVGKDADLVLWSDHPLSIYAKAEKTIVDGIIYFDREKDRQMRKQITAERNRLVNRILGEKKNGTPVVPAEPSFQVLLNCGDHDHHDKLITVHTQDIDNL